MRILMLAQFYAPVIGGEERMVQDLSRELVSHGHEVAVATLWQQGFPSYELDHGVRVYRIHGTLPRLSWLYAETERRHAPPFPDPELTWALRGIMTRERPQIVHAHNWLVHSYLPLKRFYRAPLVMTLHDHSLICATKRMMYRGVPCTGPGMAKCLSCSRTHYGAVKGSVTTVGNWVMSAFERGTVDRFLPISQATATACGLAGSHLPYEVVPDFIPNDLGEPGPVTDPRIAQLPADEFILFAGDMSADKGADVMLRAYAGLDNAPPLVLIAKSELPKPPELLRNVIILNNWPHDAVMEAWRRCTFALVPSVLAEPFGLVAIEAMSAGRAVIASRTGGLADIVVDGETGILVTPNDSLDLRLAIKRLLGDPILRKRMGQAGKLRVNRYRASTVLPQVEKVYQALLEAQGGRH